MDFNLPPGVRVWDIPGNRPEDIAWERWLEGLAREVRLVLDGGDEVALNRLAEALDLPTFEDFLNPEPDE